MPMPIPAAVTTRLNAVKNVGDSAVGFVTNLLASLEDLLGEANVFGSAAEKDAGAAAGNLPVLDAQGKLAVGVMPNLDASRITSGELAPDRIPNLPLSKFGTGTLAADRIDPAIARLASPTFTGEPKAPTAATGDNSTRLATTAFVQQEAGDYATLASPVFTGTPKISGAPPGSADSSTKVATTAFVQSALTRLVYRNAWGGDADIGNVAKTFPLFRPANEIDALGLLFEIASGTGPRRFVSVFYPGHMTTTETALDGRYGNWNIQFSIRSLPAGTPNAAQGGLSIRKRGGNSAFSLRNILTII